MRKILNILVLFSIILTIFMPLTYLKADTNTYSVVSIKSDGSINELGSYNDYNSAFNKMKEYNSNVNDVAVIRKNDKIVYAAYGIFRPSVSNSTIYIYSKDGSKLSYISPSYDSDTLFLDYDPSNNMVKIMISGLIGWVSLDKGDIHPISYITDGTSSLYDKNKKYVKILYQNGIRLREGAGTEFKQIGCNGAHTCTLQDGGIWASGGAIYEWLDNEKIEKIENIYGSDKNYAWYKVNINGNIGYIGNEIATKDLEEYNPITGNKQDFNTYYYVSSNGELYHKYYATVSSSKVWSIKLGKSPLYLKSGVNYYSFDGNYFYDDFTKMVNDLRMGVYKNAVNKMPYYNYYQYLPTRTQSHYNADNLNTYINLNGGSGYNSKINKDNFYEYSSENNEWVRKGEWTSFPINQSMLYGEGENLILSQEKYGVNAVQTLALAINESGDGRSEIAVLKNNIFGHSAYDGSALASARTYATVADSIFAHALEYIAMNYANPINGYNYYGSHYGNKLSGNNVSYASDAYWGEKMANNYYKIDGYFGFQDFNQRAILGVKQSDIAAPVYKEPNTKSTKYYNLKNISNIPVTILDTVIGEDINGNNTWYKIQSDLPIDENRNLVNVKSGNYSFDTSYAYIHSSYIYKESKEPVIYASDITIKNGSKFEPLKSVSAYDAWDGDVTDKIRVLENNVNTKKSGTYNVTYKVVDSENNEAIKSINVKVLSSNPTINASDKTIYVGDNFNPLDGVTASDAEDGNITNKLIITKNTVDTSKLGNYEVIYKIVDNDNNEVTKTISVKVIEKKLEIKDAIFYLDYIKNVDGNLQIKGYNTINGINNNLDENINYEIEFTNIDSGKTYIQKAIRITEKKEMTRPAIGLDDMDYTYSWFKLNVDLNSLSDGNYQMKIISSTNKYKSVSVISNKLYTIQDTYFDGNKKVITRNNFDDKKGPIELIIRSKKLVEKTASAVYNQYDTYRTFEFDTNGLLHLKGVSYSYGMDLSKNKNVNREIIFENIKDYNLVYRYQLGSISDGLYNVVLPVDDNLNKDKAWYDKLIDITNIPIGRYVIYLTTSSNITDISEFTEKLNRDISNVALTKDNKKYYFEINKQRGNRIELIVEKI